MRRSSDFGATVRRGRRAGNSSVVVHVLTVPAEPQVPVVGLVVSKAVGGAVVRNRTKRRLRALIRPLLGRLTPGSRVVVRAQPAAAAASSTTLARDLVRALERAGALTPSTGPASPGAEVRS